MSSSAAITALAIPVVRYRLAADTTLLPDSVLVAEMNSVMTELFARLPGIGGPVDLAEPSGGVDTPTDGDHFAEALALISCIRLEPAVELNRSGGLASSEQGGLKESFRKPDDMNATKWADQAEAALARISVLQTATAALSTFNPFQVSGRTRRAEEVGIYSFAELVRSLSEAVARWE
ncbi:MAG TPA: hypothetical protein VGM37_01375 [Armatimonadota bacterium]|jgi:hypothetical protein